MTDALVLTCEHAGNQIPAAYQSLFRSAQAQAALTSHQGFDPGAFEVATILARELKNTLLAHQVSRLLVEPNRSPGHRNLWSSQTRDLDEPTKTEILACYYHPHRDRVTEAVSSVIGAKQRAVQIAMHSFARTLNGDHRETDIGILYDSRRRAEQRWAGRLVMQLRPATPALRIHRNRPYRGSADGLTTLLRRQFSANNYLGFEIEICQDLIKDRAGSLAIANVLSPAILSALNRS
jgi:predicted N-formylglutamate amidohydrolase